MDGARRFRRRNSGTAWSRASVHQSQGDSERAKGKGYVRIDRRGWSGYPLFGRQLYDRSM